MFDLNLTPSSERQEDQGQQSKRPGDNSPSRSHETSQERFERNIRFLRTISESSVQEARSENLKAPEQVQEAPEKQAAPRKRKYEWKKQENKFMRSETSKKQWEDEAYRKKMSETSKKQWEDEAFRGKISKAWNSGSRNEARKRRKEQKEALEIQWKQEEKQG